MHHDYTLFLGILYIVSSNTFSVGIEWLYNEWDTVKDNFATPYYADLKSEIMEYKYIQNNKTVYNYLDKQWLIIKLIWFKHY